MAAPLGQNVYALRRTAIAACCLSTQDEQRIYFQDYDGCIREIRGSEAHGYTGGDSGSVIHASRNAKFYTPLAVVSAEHESKQVTLFYVDRRNHLRGIVCNNGCWQHIHAFDCMEVAVCPSSRLATLRYDDGKSLVLYYQQQDHMIRELKVENDGPYTLTETSIPALVGSNISVAKWMADDNALQEIIIFYQDEASELRSAYYNPPGPFNDGYTHIRGHPPNCGFASCGHRHLGFNADVARFFTVKPDGKVLGWIWTTESPEWTPHEYASALVESKVAMDYYPSSNNPEIRVFFQGDDQSLQLLKFENRQWVGPFRVPSGG